MQRKPVKKKKNGKCCYNFTATKIKPMSFVLLVIIINLFPSLVPVNWYNISFLSNLYLPVATWASTLIVTLGSCDVCFWASKVELQSSWITGIEIFETFCTLNLSKRVSFVQCMKIKGKIHQAPVVQRLANPIYPINRYPADKC